MGLDDNKYEDVGFTWEQMMRLRGYDEDFIRAARERREKRAIEDLD